MWKRVRAAAALIQPGRCLSGLGVTHGMRRDQLDIMGQGRACQDPTKPLTDYLRGPLKRWRGQGRKRVEFIVRGGKNTIGMYTLGPSMD